MATYKLSNVTEKYTFAAQPPVLDRVVFTIDHIHMGNDSVCSTYEVVKFLVDRDIPVVVFMQATNPSNNYEYDRNSAGLIYNLAPHLVTLGVHPLPKGNTQAAQTKVHNTLREIIKDITGTYPATLSYHGAAAGPEAGITFSGIKYARGILSAWAAGTDDPKNTPVVVMNSVSRAFAYTSQRNAAGYSSTIFFHTSELRENSTKKLIFDTFIQEVVSRRLQAVPYMSAMNVDFKATATPTPTPVPTPVPTPTPTPPISSGAMGSLRLSASSEIGRRPVNVDFLIENLNGDDIAKTQNVKTQAYRIPAGQYKITATMGSITKTTTINLTATKGLHHIFMMPAASSSTTIPTTPAPGGTTAFGSLRLSASTKVGRRPVNADFLVEGIGNTTVEIAKDTKTNGFRLPVGSYKVSAKIGNVTETANINLTATQGIHHIFLMPAAESSSSTPTPGVPSVSTPPANSAGLGSLRLSASTQVGRRPVAVDFEVEKANGDAVRNASNVTTQLFRLPAGQYKAIVKLGSTTEIKMINLTATQGIHHIFLVPT